MALDCKYQDDCAGCFGKNMEGASRGLFDTNLLQERAVKLFRIGKMT